MTEPSPNPRHYDPVEPNPEAGLIPAVRTVRRELLKHPAPLTAAAIEIERLRNAVDDAQAQIIELMDEADRLRNDLTMARADWRNTLAALKAAREAIENYLDGNYERASNNQRCKHGIWSWEACENCIDEHFTAALAALEPKP